MSQVRYHSEKKYKNSICTPTIRLTVLDEDNVKVSIEREANINMYFAFIVQVDDLYDLGKQLSDYAVGKTPIEDRK